MQSDLRMLTVKDNQIVALTPYYTLLLRDEESGRWGVEFGSFDLEDVKSEAEELHEGFQEIENDALIILVTNSAWQAEIDRAIEALNYQQEYQ